MNRLSLAALAVLATAGTLVPLEAPLRAEPTGAAVKDRTAALCTASDTDLVGKRLARECRRQHRATAETRERVTSDRDARRVAVRAR